MNVRDADLAVSEDVLEDVLDVLEDALAFVKVAEMHVRIIVPEAVKKGVDSDAQDGIINISLCDFSSF